MKNKWLLFLAILAIFMLAPAAFCCSIDSSIGDRVWNDFNKDGIQEDGELGLVDVTVKLYRSNGDFFDDTTTDSTGIFSFSVPAGEYYLEFILPSGYSFSMKDQGGDNAIDSDADVSTGLTIHTTLDPYENDTTWDAGMHAVPIPGAVWLLGSGLVGLVGIRKKLKK
ncbi:MAG: hypothetical protein KAV87_65750 [Desulfobacteraceae bacterium]|nr:hypothetical protein [Desulfobacteraceae bacterium]